MAFAQTPAASPHRDISVPDAALLTKYCVTCHNDRAKTGGLTLEKVDLANIPANAETWEKVIRKLRTGAMPPAGRGLAHSAVVKQAWGTLRFEMYTLHDF